MLRNLPPIRESSTWRCRKARLSVLSRLADAVRREPGGFLGDAEIAAQLHGPAALEAGREEIERDGPLLEAEAARQPSPLRAPSLPPLLRNPRKDRACRGRGAGSSFRTWRPGSYDSPARRRIAYRRQRGPTSTRSLPTDPPPEAAPDSRAGVRYPRAAIVADISSIPRQAGPQTRRAARSGIIPGARQPLVDPGFQHPRGPKHHHPPRIDAHRLTGLRIAAHA